MGMIGNLLRVTQTELDAYLKDSSLLEKRIYQEENQKLVDIDKSWDGIHYLLTGRSVGDNTHPLTKVFFSGQLVDTDQDLGNGPAHFVTPEQVKEINAQISKLTRDELAIRYDPKKMSSLHIYPNIWEMDEVLDYLLEYFESVQELYALAAQNDEAVVTFIN